MRQPTADHPTENITHSGGGVPPADVESPGELTALVPKPLVAYPLNSSAISRLQQLPERIPIDLHGPFPDHFPIL